MNNRNRQSQTAISLTSPISTERSEDNPESLDTNLVCMFKVLFVRFSKLQNLHKESTSSCPALVERVKSSIESNISGRDGRPVPRGALPAGKGGFPAPPRAVGRGGLPAPPRKNDQNCGEVAGQNKAGPAARTLKNNLSHIF